MGYSMNGQIDERTKDGINLIDCWLVTKRYKRLIGTIVGSVTILSIVISLLLPKVYRGEAVIMPLGGGIGSENSMAAIASQLSGLPFLGNMGGIVNSASQRLVAILNTRTIAEEIIKRHGLMKEFFKDSWDEKKQEWKNLEEVPSMEEAVIDLKRSMQFKENKETGVIKIAADFRDPQLAADVANGYVVKLQEIINKKSFTMAKRNRIFIEKQLADSKRSLLEVGREINEFYKDGRVSDIESRVNVSLNVGDESDFDINGLLRNSKNEKDDIWNLLEDRKDELQKKLNETNIVKDVPQQVYLQYLNLRRELLGKINALLTQQYEMAKIEEAKEDLAFQVIDPARVPEMRYKPKRRMIVMLAFSSSLLLSLFIVFLLEYIRRIKESYQAGVNVSKTKKV